MHTHTTKLLVVAGWVVINWLQSFQDVEEATVLRGQVLLYEFVPIDIKLKKKTDFTQLHQSSDLKKIHYAESHKLWRSCLEFEHRETASLSQ